MSQRAWRWSENGWRHRPWWKVAINKVLRAVQPRLRRKWVVVSVCEGGDDDDRGFAS